MPPAIAELPTIKSEYLSLKTALTAEIANLDDQTLADTLEGITSLHEILGEILRSALLEQALADGLGQLIKNYQARHDKIQHRVERKRDLVRKTLLEAQIPRLTEPDFTATLKDGPEKVEVHDETLIPEKFWKPQPAKLDRALLRATLKSGEQLSGATISQGDRVLQVRVT